jgi:hypothetical protein
MRGSTSMASGAPPPRPRCLRPSRLHDRYSGANSTSRGYSFRVLRWEENLRDGKLVLSPRQSLGIVGEGTHWHYHPALGLTWFEQGEGRALRCRSDRDVRPRRPGASRRKCAALLADAGTFSRIVAAAYFPIRSSPWVLSRDLRARGMFSGSWTGNPLLGKLRARTDRTTQPVG